MLFTTPAKTLTPKELNDHNVFEAGRIWSLQNTVNREYFTLDACWNAGEDLVDQVFPVGTLTIRYYCHCDSNNSSCPTTKEGFKQVLAMLEKRRDAWIENWNKQDRKLERIKDSAARKLALERHLALKTSRTNFFKLEIDELKEDFAEKAIPAAADLQLEFVMPKRSDDDKKKEGGSNSRTFQLFPLGN